MQKILAFFVTLALSACYAATPAAAISCTISQTNIAFGNVNLLSGAAVDTTGSITLSCTGAIPANKTWRFCTNMEAGPDASGSQRRMASGGNFLQFELYTDSARTVPWGSWISGFKTAGSQNDFTASSSTISGTMTVYARLLSGQQTAAVGSYTETFTGGGGANSTDTRYNAQSSGGGCLVGTSNAYAPTWNVTANLLSNCNVSVSPLNFGSTSSLSSNVDSTAVITVQCTIMSPYSIGLDNGTYANGSQRRMQLGATGNHISYGLYTDSARTQPWGATTSTTSCTAGTGTCYLGTGTGLNQTATIYGRVPPQAIPALGTFNDTVILTVTY